MFFRKYTLFNVICICFFSCTKQPEASFSYSSNNFWTFEYVYFDNNSINSFYYEWDFGNGESSTDIAPFIFYEKPGEYTVTLTSYTQDRKKSNTYIQTITILQPTDLLLKIIKKVGSAPIENCSVTLYETFSDWENYTNNVGSAYSDFNGQVYFRNLDTIEYYIDAYIILGDSIFSNWESGIKSQKLIAENINEYLVLLQGYHKPQIQHY